MIKGSCFCVIVFFFCIINSILATHAINRQADDTEKLQILLSKGGTVPISVGIILYYKNIEG